MFTNTSTASAAQNGNRKLVKSKKTDMSSFHKKLDNIKTEEDIYALSDEATIIKNKKDDNFTEYLIKHDTPIKCNTYSDGSTESSYEIDALLVKTPVEDTSDIQLFSIEEHSSTSDDSLDLSLKATMVYTAKTTAGYNVTCYKLTSFSGKIVSFAENYKDNFQINATQKGEQVRLSDGEFIGMTQEGWTDNNVIIPYTGTTYSYNSGFNNYYRADNCILQVTVGLYYSHGGLYYYWYQWDLAIGNNILCSYSPSGH